MAHLSRDEIARRLRAVREELNHSRSAMAEALGASKGFYYVWEAGETAHKPTYPAEEAMARLCDMLPGLTLDYLYRGRLDTMPAGLAIRLTAREVGLDPDSPPDQQAARQAYADRLAASA